MKQKKQKTIEKVEMSKMPTVNPLSLANNYIYIINLLLQSGLTGVIFLLMKKTCNIWSDGRIYICLIILHDYSFFSKSIFGATIG